MVGLDYENGKVDLHCHTNNSDGENTPEETIQQAVEAGV